MPPTRLLAAAVLLLSACSGGGGHSATRLPAPSPTGIPGVVHVAELSHDHVTKKVDYPQHPPLGGPHWPPVAKGVYGWQRCGVYTEPVVDEFAVHSLEHGAVWLTYRPGTPAADVQQLAALSGIRPDYVLVSPYPGQAGQVVATAWGSQLTLTSATDPRLAQFVREYAGGAQGGEPGSDCAHGTMPEQARAALASVSR